MNFFAQMQPTKETGELRDTLVGHTTLTNYDTTVRAVIEMYNFDPSLQNNIETDLIRRG